MPTRCKVLQKGQCEITQGFGGSNNHRGLDLVGAYHTLDNVVSYDSGKVLMAVTGYGNGAGQGVNWRYGNFVKILHDDGKVTLYAHLSYTDLKVGQRVSKGQLIGGMGNSGNCFGAHLHWELWTRDDYNSNIDPMPYLEPKSEIVKAKAVAKDTKVDQFEILVDSTMKCRSSRSTKNDDNFLYIINKGLYNVLSNKTENGYTWIEVAKNQFVAILDGYTKLIKKQEEVKPNIEAEELKKEIEALTKEHDIIVTKNEELEKENIELKDKIKLLETQIANNNNFNNYEAEENKQVYISLKKGNILMFKVL